MRSVWCNVFFAAGIAFLLLPARKPSPSGLATAEVGGAPTPAETHSANG